MTPEFSRPFAVERLGETPIKERIEANAVECAGLAQRFRLPALHALSADLTLTPAGGGKVIISGLLSAKVDQTCVVTLEPFENSVNTEISRMFIPASKAQIAANDMDPASDDDEVDTYENGVIDLGEFAAEELALALDPYPRRPGVAFEGWAEDAPEPAGDDKVRPFDKLKGLKGGEG